jgi:hypothetical protein
MQHRQWFVLAVGAAFIVACTGDKSETPKAAADASANASAQSADDYRKAQQRFADSVLNQSQGAAQIVARLGGNYKVGSVRLRDSLAVLSEKSGCFLDGRKSDPYLAGTVSFYVFMSVVGSNVVRVDEPTTVWTSPAGNIVTSCLNLAAKNWKFDTSFGNAAEYITQVQFK